MAPIEPGRKLGPYEIVAPLAAGGMGKLFKARDTRLDRTVAVKVLPEALVENPDVRERFQREARAISKVSHPRICALYDVGREDGVDFLVLEYLEGETLAEKVRRGPMPLEEAIRYARQIADALHQAHLRGVVHRDLKPGNVMLTKGGVKLLDFGLAKLKSPAVASLSSAVATQNQPLTREGAILGTLHYMAPEQLEGKESDARADIFALGCVLYEMVTGRKAFEGESPASIITAILSKTPTPMAELISLTPPALERLVSECLAKDPDARWQSASDLGKNLDWILAPAKETAKPRRRLIPPLLGALLLLSAGAVPILLSRYEPEKAVVRFSVFPPEGATFDATFGESARVSPDGKHLAFTVRSGGDFFTVVRALDDVGVRTVARAERGRQPFWSPDSRSIAYISDGKLQRVDVEGGPARTIADIGAPSAFNGTWISDDVILVGCIFGGIHSVSPSGGELSAVTELLPGQVAQGAPSFLPDGKRFLYFAASSSEESRGIYLASLAGEAKRLLAIESTTEYVEPGYLLYVRDRTLLAHRFDVAEGRLTGEPLSLVEGLESLASFSVGGDVLAYRKGLPRTQLTWRDREGKALGTPGEPAPYWNLALSRDAKRVVVSSGGVWLVDLERGGIASPLNSTSPFESNHVFSPNGREIAFSSDARGNFDLYKVSLAAGAEPELLLDQEAPVWVMDWSSDGKQMVVVDRASSVWALPLEGERVPVRRVPGGTFRIPGARLSPDGKWLAYSSNETGRFEVYLQPLVGGERVRVSRDGGGQPHWRDDGQELFYLGLSGVLMSVDFDTRHGRASIAKALFPTGLSFDPVDNQYGVAPGGEKFLLLLPVGSEEPLTVVLNWQTLLRPP